MKNEYYVNVGNIGNIEASNKAEAVKTFNEYVRQSKRNNLRASQEDVVLFMNGEIEKEFNYSEYYINRLNSLIDTQQEKVDGLKEDLYYYVQNLE